MQGWESVLTVGVVGCVSDPKDFQVFHDVAIEKESSLSSAGMSGGDKFWGEYVAVAIDEAQDCEKMSLLGLGEQDTHTTY